MGYATNLRMSLSCERGLHRSLSAAWIRAGTILFLRRCIEGGNGGPHDPWSEGPCSAGNDASLPDDSITFTGRLEPESGWVNRGD